MLAASRHREARRGGRVGYVERHLLPNEQVLYKTRLHWILFLKPALVFLCGAILATLLAQVPNPPWLWHAGSVVMAVGAGWGAAQLIELRTSEFAVTTTRLILKVGLVARYTTELLLSKVEAVSVRQGLMGRLLNYGDLAVTGTGGVREVFQRVQDPIGFRNHVQHASVAAEHSPGAAPPGSPAPGSSPPGRLPLR
jgi:uncharacterized membrane protein YdbT with pleckstrin-like domain